MKTFILVIFSFLGVGFCNSSLAQHEGFKAGFYINQKNDTIKGFFRIKNGNVLSEMKIKDGVKEPGVSIISLDSCKSFYLGEDFYLIWFGKRSLTHINKMDFVIVNLDSSVTEKIPVKLLYKGNRLSLYYYYDVTDHFFIGIENSIQELAISYQYPTDWEKKKYIVNSPTYEINPIYRYQLVALLSDNLTNKQRYLVENCEYEKRALVKLLKKVDPIKK